jgi:superfamily II helicase
MSKTCNTCYINKPINFFTKEKTCPDGHRGRCKECDKERKQKHYQENKEKYKEAYDEFLKRNSDYQKKYYKLKKFS